MGQTTMNHEVSAITVPATPLLIVRRRAAQSELSRVIPEACGLVWNAVRRLGVTSAGRHVALYTGCVNGRFDLEIGVEAGADAVADGEVVLSATPAGRVATVTHMGPYTGLREAHDAVQEWCREHKERPHGGPSWEVYGHMNNDDPAAVRTDIFYLLS